MKKENIPNALTLIRVVMIPIFIAILSLSHSYLGHIVAAVIFAIASITDYLDGFLARKWNVVSNFGKFADPMADKLLVMSAFIMMIELKMVPAWIAAVIICRELAVCVFSLLRQVVQFLLQPCQEKLKPLAKCLPLSFCFAIGHFQGKCCFILH